MATVREMITGLGFKTDKKDVKDYDNSLKGMQKRTQQASSTMGAALKSVLLPLAGFLSARAFISFGNDAVEAFKMQESAIASLNAGLKATDNAIGKTSEELQKMASVLQEKTIFGDEAILQNVTNQFLTFGNISGDALDRAQRATLDVTAKLKGLNASGEDLRSTSIMLGKALDDPARGLSSLRRVGISFSKSEADMIKGMQKSGDTLGAQNEMLRLIEKQYGGTAEALAGTDAGKIVQAQNRIGDSMERIGKILIPLKIKFLELKSIVVDQIGAIVAEINKWREANKEMIATKIDESIANIKLALSILIPVIKTVWKIFSGLIKAIAPFAPLIIGIIAVMQAYVAIQAILNGLMIAYNVIMGLNPTVVIIGLIIGAIWLLYKNWDKISAFILRMWDKIVRAFKFGVRLILGFFKQWGSSLILILGPFGVLINVIINLFKRWSDIKEAFQTGGIVAGLRKIGEVIFEAMIKPLQTVLNLIAKIPGVGKYAQSASASLTTMQNNIGGDTPDQSLSPIQDNLTGNRPAQSLSAIQDNLTGNRPTTATNDRYSSVPSQIMNNQSNRTVTTNNNVTASVQVQVPPGTPVSQQKYLQEQTRQVVRDEMGSAMRGVQKNNRRTEQ